MIISQTPLRISFVGGGTDFKLFYSKHPGMVISSAIDKYIFVIVNERFDSMIYVNSSKKERVERVEDISHDLVREAMNKTAVSNGIEITILADIPSDGSGLGSSSSLTVGLLNALYQFKGIQTTAKQLAEEACDIEINILKKPIGKQDQYIAAHGGIKKIIFNVDERVYVQSLHFNSENRIKLGSNLLLHYTNITRKSESILKEQNRNSDKNFNLLVTLANHVPKLQQEFENRNWDALGNILKENWELKKSLATGISKPEIEEMVDVALKNGALGVKIAGAGGGGFLLSYVPRDVQDKFRRAMGKYTEMPFMLDPFGSRIIFNMRRYNAKTYS